MKHLNVERISARLSEKGYSQATLAEKLGLSREAVSQWFKQEKFPRPAMLLQLSKELSLSFDEMVLAEPDPSISFAYRTNRNAEVDDHRLMRARDMQQALLAIRPHLQLANVFTLPSLANPSLDYQYLQNAVSQTRQQIGYNVSQPIEETGLIAYMRKFNTLFIPVLWGTSGDNALHIGFENNAINFIYLNLQKSTSDIKYWLAHELAHIMTPQLAGDAAEEFAERFAAALLFPQALAADLCAKTQHLSDPGHVINLIIQAASFNGISPITVYYELNKYRSEHKLPALDFDIHPAAANYSKSVSLFSTVLFEESQPSIEKYLHTCASKFGQEFWQALSVWLRENHKAPGAVQRILDLPTSDAKGVWEYLVHQKDPA